MSTTNLPHIKFSDIVDQTLYPSDIAIPWGREGSNGIVHCNFNDWTYWIEGSQFNNSEVIPFRRNSPTRWGVYCKFDWKEPSWEAIPPQSSIVKVWEAAYQQYLGNTKTADIVDQALSPLYSRPSDEYLYEILHKIKTIWQDEINAALPHMRNVVQNQYYSVIFWIPPDIADSIIDTSEESSIKSFDKPIVNTYLVRRNFMDTDDYMYDIYVELSDGVLLEELSGINSDDPDVLKIISGNTHTADLIEQALNSSEFVITSPRDFEKYIHVNFDTMTYWVESNNIHDISVDKPSRLRRVVLPNNKVVYNVAHEPEYGWITSSIQDDYDILFEKAYQQYIGNINKKTLDKSIRRADLVYQTFQSIISFNVDHISKNIYEDSYEHGDIGNESFFDIDTNSRNYTSIKQLADKYGLPENIDYWIAYNKRLMCQLMEDGDGQEVSSSDRRWAQFVAGDINLWAASYNFYVDEITLEDGSVIETDALGDDVVEELLSHLGVQAYGSKKGMTKSSDIVEQTLSQPSYLNIVNSIEDDSIYDLIKPYQAWVPLDIFEKELSINTPMCLFPRILAIYDDSKVGELDSYLINRTRFRQIFHANWTRIKDAGTFIQNYTVVDESKFPLVLISNDWRDLQKDQKKLYANADLIEQTLKDPEEFQLDKNYIGDTISEGTLNPMDILDTFNSYLQTNAPSVWSDFYYENKDDMDKLDVMIHQDRIGNEIDYDTFFDEVGNYLIEKLEDILNEIAPKGTYFGANEGDGALFGFWTNTDVEDEGGIIRGGSIKFSDIVEQTLALPEGEPLVQWIYVEMNEEGDTINARKTAWKSFSRTPNLIDIVVKYLNECMQEEGTFFVGSDIKNGILYGEGETSEDIDGTYSIDAHLLNMTEYEQEAIIKKVFSEVHAASFKSADLVNQIFVEPIEGSEVKVIADLDKLHAIYMNSKRLNATCIISEINYNEWFPYAKSDSKYNLSKGTIRTDAGVFPLEYWHEFLEILSYKTADLVEQTLQTHPTLTFTQIYANSETMETISSDVFKTVEFDSNDPELIDKTVLQLKQFQIVDIWEYEYISNLSYSEEEPTIVNYIVITLNGYDEVTQDKIYELMQGHFSNLTSGNLKFSDIVDMSLRSPFTNMVYDDGKEYHIDFSTMTYWVHTVGNVATEEIPSRLMKDNFGIWYFNHPLYDNDWHELRGPNENNFINKVEAEYQEFNRRTSSIKTSDLVNLVLNNPTPKIGDKVKFICTPQVLVDELDYGRGVFGPGYTDFIWKVNRIDKNGFRFDTNGGRNSAHVPKNNWDRYIKVVEYKTADLIEQTLTQPIEPQIGDVMKFDMSMEEMNDLFYDGGREGGDMETGEYLEMKVLKLRVERIDRDNLYPYGRSDFGRGIIELEAIEPGWGEYVMPLTNWDKFIQIIQHKQADLIEETLNQLKPKFKKDDLVFVEPLILDDFSDFVGHVVDVYMVDDQWVYDVQDQDGNVEEYLYEKQLSSDDGEGINTEGSLTFKSVKPEQEIFVCIPVPDEVRKKYKHVEGLEDELHITLTYVPNVELTDGKKQKIIDALRKVCADYVPVSCQFTGLGSFDNGDNTFAALVNIPEGAELQTIIENAIESAYGKWEKKFGYLPHVTLKYDGDGETDLKDLRDYKWVCEELQLQFSDPSKEIIYLTLGKDEVRKEKVNVPKESKISKWFHKFSQLFTHSVVPVPIRQQLDYPNFANVVKSDLVEEVLKFPEIKIGDRVVISGGRSLLIDAGIPPLDRGEYIVFYIDENNEGWNDWGLGEIRIATKQEIEEIKEEQRSGNSPDLRDYGFSIPLQRWSEFITILPSKTSDLVEEILNEPQIKIGDRVIFIGSSEDANSLGLSIERMKNIIFKVTKIDEFSKTWAEKHIGNIEILEEFGDSFYGWNIPFDNWSQYLQKIREEKTADLIEQTLNPIVANTPKEFIQMIKPYQMWTSEPDNDTTRLLFGNTAVPLDLDTSNEKLVISKGVWVATGATLFSPRHYYNTIVYFADFPMRLVEDDWRTIVSKKKADLIEEVLNSDIVVNNIEELKLYIKPNQVWLGAKRNNSNDEYPYFITYYDTGEVYNNTVNISEPLLGSANAMVIGADWCAFMTDTSRRSSSAPICSLDFPMKLITMNKKADIINQTLFSNELEYVLDSAGQSFTQVFNTFFKLNRVKNKLDINDNAEVTIRAKNVGRNVVMIYRNNDPSIAAKYHNTEIITFYPNYIELNLHGFHTKTTGERISSVLNAIGLGIRVHFNFHRGDYEYLEGMANPQYTNRQGVLVGRLTLIDSSDRSVYIEEGLQLDYTGKVINADEEGVQASLKFSDIVELSLNPKEYSFEFEYRIWHINFEKGIYWIEGSNVSKEDPSFLRRVDERWQFKHPDMDVQSWTFLNRDKSDIIERLYQEEYRTRNASLKFSDIVEQSIHDDTYWNSQLDNIEQQIDNDYVEAKASDPVIVALEADANVVASPTAPRPTSSREDIDGFRLYVLSKRIDYKLNEKGVDAILDVIKQYAHLRGWEILQWVNEMEYFDFSIAKRFQTGVEVYHVRGRSNTLYIPSFLVDQLEELEYFTYMLDNLVYDNDILFEDKNTITNMRGNYGNTEQLDPMSYVSYRLNELEDYGNYNSGDNDGMNVLYNMLSSMMIDDKNASPYDPATFEVPEHWPGYSKLPEDIEAREHYPAPNQYEMFDSTGKPLKRPQTVEKLYPEGYPRNFASLTLDKTSDLVYDTLNNVDWSSKDWPYMEVTNSMIRKKFKIGDTIEAPSGAQFKFIILSPVIVLKSIKENVIPFMWREVNDAWNSGSYATLKIVLDSHGYRDIDESIRTADLVNEVLQPKHWSSDDWPYFETNNAMIREKFSVGDTIEHGSSLYTFIMLYPVIILEEEGSELPFTWRNEINHWTTGSYKTLKNYLHNNDHDEIIPTIMKTITGSGSLNKFVRTSDLISDALGNVTVYSLSAFVNELAPYQIWERSESEGKDKLFTKDGVAVISEGTNNIALTISPATFSSTTPDLEAPFGDTIIFKSFLPLTRISEDWRIYNPLDEPKEELKPLTIEEPVVQETPLEDRPAEVDVAREPEPVIEAPEEPEAPEGVEEEAPWIDLPTAYAQMNIGEIWEVKTGTRTPSIWNIHNRINIGGGNYRFSINIDGTDYALTTPKRNQENYVARKISNAVQASFVISLKNEYIKENHLKTISDLHNDLSKLSDDSEHNNIAFYGFVSPQGQYYSIADFGDIYHRPSAEKIINSIPSLQQAYDSKVDPVTFLLSLGWIRVNAATSLQIGQWNGNTKSLVIEYLSGLPQHWHVVIEQEQRVLYEGDVKDVLDEINIQSKKDLLTIKFSDWAQYLQSHEIELTDFWRYARKNQIWSYIRLGLAQQQGEYIRRFVRILNIDEESDHIYGIYGNSVEEVMLNNDPSTGQPNKDKWINIKFMQSYQEPIEYGTPIE